MIDYAINAPVTSAELNRLFSAGGPGAGWPAWQRKPDTSDWDPALKHSLAYVTARTRGTLVGFVNVAWDGRDHAFLLDTRVHPDHRHQHIGTELVLRARAAAGSAGCEVLHVDHEGALTPFYESCGFEPTAAGLIRLR
ncbi:MAG: GNAT family N-acetyltransferase [Myxococcales bacterium]|nr:GNAT family N-acetyltransferase [Myxococcales bacterium]